MERIVGVPSCAIPRQLRPLTGTVIQRCVPGLNSAGGRLASVSGTLRNECMRPNPNKTPSDNRISMLPAKHGFCNLSRETLPAGVTCRLNVRLTSRIVTSCVLGRRQCPRAVNVVL